MEHSISVEGLLAVGVWVDRDFCDCIRQLFGAMNLVTYRLLCSLDQTGDLREL